MAHRPIPFSTDNQSRSARSPFYKADRAKHGKAVSKGMKRASGEREVRRREEEENSLAEAVSKRR